MLALVTKHLETQKSANAAMVTNMLTFTTKPERLEIRWGDLSDEEQVRSLPSLALSPLYILTHSLTFTLTSPIILRATRFVRLLAGCPLSS